MASKQQQQQQQQKKKQNSNQNQWSMYPSLHDEVSQLLSDHNLTYTFHPVFDAKKALRTYDTNIMGRFICHKKSCSTQAWSSKIIAITICLYPNREYNARVYHQRCSNCNTLSRPILDHSYAERVAYRIKKWAGVVGVDERPPYREKKMKGPHLKHLCEGCTAGHCLQLNV